MKSKNTRRSFIGSTSAWLGVGIPGLASLASLSANEGEALNVALNVEIAPLVRLIENTPREKSVAMMIGELRKGTTRNQFVAAMFLASARIKVSPHHVFMIYDALRLSNAMKPGDQLLPLFWALDTLYYRREEGDRYRPVKIRNTPSELRATQELRESMDRFDGEAAASAIVALSRSTSPKAAMSELSKYAGRDDSFIGHRAIALVNCWRVLETIGWQHAEPIFQFVVRQLNEGGNRHRQHEHNWDRSTARFAEVPVGWESNRTDPARTLELFEVMRLEDEASACETAFKMLLTGKVQAGSIWDAVYLLGADFMIRYPESRDIGTTPLHTNTSANSLRFVFDECTDLNIRMYTLLAAVAWATKFYGAERKTREGRAWLRDLKITDLTIREVGAQPEEVVAEIFTLQPKRRHDESQQEILTGREGTREDQDKVAELTFSYAHKHPDHSHYFQAARLLTSMKSTQDAHDLKFPAAIFENYGQVNPKWRPHLIAASSHYMHGTRMPDNPAVSEAKMLLETSSRQPAPKHSK